MKYWRGYLVAGILAAAAWAMNQFAEAHTQLVDMVYPYVTRSVQSFLTAWTGGFEFLVWQTAILFLVIVLIATLVLVFIFRTKIIRWLGWAAAAIAAAAPIIYFFSMIASSIPAVNTLQQRLRYCVR